jgi:hypothetical protein
MNKDIAAESSTFAVHAACLVVVAAASWVGLTFLQGMPALQMALSGAAAWLWGKYGFKPSDPVLAKILQTMSVGDIARLSNRPVPLAPPPVPSATDPAPPPVHDDEITKH